MAERPATQLDVGTELCTLGGVDHDFRPKVWDTCYGTTRTSWVCVWCDGIACGDYAEADPCWRIYHHHEPHRTRSGVEWPIGGNRP